MSDERPANERRAPTLDYRRPPPPLAAPECFGWRDVAVIVLIVFGPFVLWFFHSLLLR